MRNMDLKVPQSWHELDNNNQQYYCSKWDSEEHSTRNLIDDCYNLDRIMGNLSYYFNYNAFALDLFMNDYYFEDGYLV